MGKPCRSITFPPRRAHGLSARDLLSSCRSGSVKVRGVGVCSIMSVVVSRLAQPSQNIRALWLVLLPIQLSVGDRAGLVGDSHRHAIGSKSRTPQSHSWTLEISKSPQSDLLLGRLKAEGGASSHLRPRTRRGYSNSVS